MDRQQLRAYQRTLGQYGFGSSGPIAGGQLHFLQDGPNANLNIIGPFGIVGLTVGQVSGAPSWRVAFDPSFGVPILPHMIVFGTLSQASVGFYQPTCRIFSFVPGQPIQVDFYLIDAAGNARDPAVVFAGTPQSGVSFAVFRGSSNPPLVATIPP